MTSFHWYRLALRNIPAESHIGQILENLIHALTWILVIGSLPKLVNVFLDDARSNLIFVEKSRCLCPMLWKIVNTLEVTFFLQFLCPQRSKIGGILFLSCLSVCLCVCVCVCPSETLTSLITFTFIDIEPSYLPCVFLMTRPFSWYYF